MPFPSAWCYVSDWIDRWSVVGVYEEEWKGMLQNSNMRDIIANSPLKMYASRLPTSFLLCDSKIQTQNRQVNNCVNVKG